MKTKLWSIFLCCFCVIVLQNCSDDPQPESERIMALLNSGKWKMDAVTVDGVDKSNIYSGLTLTFTADAIKVENGKEIWPENENWSFADDGARLIKRADGLQIAIDEISETRLALSLLWQNTIYRNGRITSIAGNHKFLFTH